MTKLIVCGCNGKMGRAITACVKERPDCEIVAGFDRNTDSPAGFPVYANPQNCNVSADVVIDFSHPSALPDVLRYAEQHGMGAVIANMSLGVSLLAELAKKAAAILGGSFDVEIIEKHHNQKIDAPSGTALMLGEAVAEGLPYAPKSVYDRHAVREKRDPHEIGYSSVRGGTIVGEHEILFAGHDECISLTHTAMSKEIFAAGAVSAAAFLVGKPAGLYTMKDLMA